ncbi:MAG: hypothetical protein A3J60_03435 [Candidatus Pacebacteria bacterium RIFCSPHIGHO2_02_FULL_46_9]|nr:MAG: hypothetical protein A3J60_03435 [Candidatus Pacebacteria bacterium RIFCSPHIGHO2_02_FULL_46_9]
MHDTPLVILAAGQSSRFFPLANDHHKGFCAVAGKPLISHTLENAYRAGVRTVFVVVSPQDSLIAGQLVTGLPTDFTISIVTQPMPLGMGDALLQLQPQLPQHFFVVSPYHVTSGPILKSLQKKQRATQCSCVLAGEVTAHPKRYGIIEYADDRVTRVIEKPTPSDTTSRMKISSVYLLNSEYLQALAATKQSEYNFEVALNEYVQQANVCWIENSQQLPTLKYAWQLLDLMQLLLAQQQPKRAATAVIAKTAILNEANGPVVLADHAEIRDFAKIIGPAYIGEHALIGEYSFVRQSALEYGARVGAYTEVVRSLLHPEATIHQSYLADSILGPKTTIGAGLITANKRFDRAIIEPVVKGVAVTSEKAALGLITGNEVVLGARVTSMPGTLVGSGSSIYPQQTISGTLAKHTKYKTNREDS